jgi:hypothetical protein
MNDSTAVPETGPLPVHVLWENRGFQDTEILSFR